MRRVQDGLFGMIAVLVVGCSGAEPGEAAAGVPATDSSSSLSRAPRRAPRVIAPPGAPDDPPLPDADDEEQPIVGVKRCAPIPPTATQCVVWLQPHVGAINPANTNPLYTAAKSFLATYTERNEASAYVYPHITMIGFFRCDPAAVWGNIANTLIQIQQQTTSIGWPVVTRLRINAENDPGSKERSDRLLSLKFTEGSMTKRWLDDVVNNIELEFADARDCASKFPVAGYHLSLAHGDYTQKEIRALEDLAKPIFEPVSQWNPTKPAQPGDSRLNWDIVLYTRTDGDLPPTQFDGRFTISPTITIPPFAR